MSEPRTPADRRARRAVCRLLDRVDRALEAARELQAARAALDQEARQTPPLRVVPGESEDSDAE
jgi:hypothetical protein